MDSFGDQMRRARHAAGVNSYRLAEELGVSKAAIYAYETGRVEPSGAMKAEIERRLNISQDRSKAVAVRRKPWSDEPPAALTALVTESPSAFAAACIAIDKAKKVSPR